MRGVRFAGLLGMAMIAGAAAGCVDEEIVYRDKPLFEDPPEAAVGFMGYSNVDQKQTTCGNCHNGQQVKWVESKHAVAWSDLQANDHKADTCNDCHTVSNLGNETAEAGVKVAYSATGDERYWDVQCESCHGGGMEHVSNPSIDANKPMASMISEATEGCGECHQGSHHPFVEEWEGSRHAEVNDHVAERDAASYPSCANCHDGTFAMKNLFGVSNEYVERNDGSKHGITCIVCHDPHGNGQPAQLRMQASSHSAATNLCYQCHQRNPVPTGATTRNYPHAPQGPMVLATKLGWLPPGFTTDPIYGTHSSDANPGLCTTCHMANYGINATTNTTGHTFKAIPCKDANGAPTSDESCEMTARSYKSCLGSGCHGSEGAARGALTAADARLLNLSTELKRLVAAAKLTTKGAADWATSTTTLTPIKGADFNSQINEHDLSKGAHNPFYLDALLNASITYVKTYYGVI